MGASYGRVMRIFFLSVYFGSLVCLPAQALPRTWIGGNVDWVDAGSTANWSPADEPDSDDEAIFNTANAVNLGSNNSIQALTMSAGIDLFTNDFDLTVDGLVQLTGASTILNINGSAGSIDADDVLINSGGTVELRGGALTMDEEVGSALVDLNAGGVLQGNGVINFADTPAFTTLMLVNDGTLTALSRGLTIFSPPPVGTLTISGSVNGRIDLDGSSETGVVNVNRNQTLSTNMLLFDDFNGTLNLFHNSTYQTTHNLQVGTGGSIVIDNGFVDGGIFTDIPADTAYFKGIQLNLIGGTINVVDTDGTFQIDGLFTMSSGSFTNSGTVIFNGPTTITTAAGYDPTALDAKTIVNANFTLNDATGNFDWDGNGASDTTVNGSAQLTLTVNQVDTFDNVFGGTLTLNDSADAAVNVAATSWTMGGSLVKNGAGFSTISGDDLNITGSVNVSAGTLSLPQTFFAAGSNVTIDGLMIVSTGSQLSGPATFGGAGTFRIEGGSTTTANTTINVATFDWDGTSIGPSHSINDGVTLTINSPNFDTDGDMDDTIAIVGNGSQLIVNGPAEWVMRSTLNANTSGLGTATIGGTSRMILSGGSAVLNIDGSTIAAAPVTLGAGSTTAIDNATTLRLTGGNTTNNVNRIEGGVVNGPGILSADTGKALHGFGTINSNVDFDGASNLFAENGTLTVNGSILDVNNIGAISGGVLNIVNAWSTNVASQVIMSGGELTGGTVTVANPSSIVGRGLVSAKVINNLRLFANGGTLLFETSGNDNDWDGTTNLGVLEAGGFGSTLELRDNASFGFAGTVDANVGGRVFANGFALDFNPGSTLDLQSGTYESTNSTDIGGTVMVGAGMSSTIKVANNNFLTFEATSDTMLSGNLRLENNNINIESLATFTGSGALVIPDGSHLVVDNLANIGVLLDMQGTFRPGGFDGIGRIDLLDYQQGNTGELFVELTGTALNAFDRLVASGDVVLDGYLNIDIDGGFVPAVGNTFNIITGNTVTGTFDYADVSGMPAGLAFHIAYLGNTVQLQVVNKPFFEADFDGDGDVDPTDLAIWQGAYNLNQLGDADGDNDTDGKDFLIWQRQFGSVPLVAAATAVPEASSGLLIFSFACLMFGSRCRTYLKNRL